MIKNRNDIFKQLMLDLGTGYQVWNSSYPTNYMLNYLQQSNKWLIICLIPPILLSTSIIFKATKIDLNVQK